MRNDLMDAELARASGGVGLGEYLSVFTRRTWLIAIPFLAVLGLATALGFLLPSQYKATTIVEVQDNTDIDKIYAGTSVILRHKELLTTCKRVILTRAFLEPIVDALDVREGYNTSDPRDKTRLFTQMKNNLAVNVVMKKEGSDIIEISYTGRDAQKVCAIVNKVRTDYINYFVDDMRERVRPVLRNTRDAYAEATQKKDTAAENLQRFQEQNQLDLIGENDVPQKQKRLTVVEEQLGSGENELERLEKELDSVKLQLRGETEYVSSEKFINRTQAWKDQDEVVKRVQAELDEMLGTYRPLHKPVVEKKAELAREQEKQGKIEEFERGDSKNILNPAREELSSRERQLATTIEGLRAKMESQRKERDRLLEDVDRIPKLQRQEQGLKRQAELAFEDYRRTRRNNERATGMMDRLNSEDMSIFRIIANPLPDEAASWDPVFPSVPLFVGIGAFLGLLIGAGLAFLVEFTSSSFVTVNQLRRTLPVAVLGHVTALESPQELGRRHRRRVLVWMLLVAVVVLLVTIHVCYFDKELQSKLPTWLYGAMRRFYGAR
jgi:uncharacterized protein involved in exopolysaccharide biosynthesis